MGAVLGIVRYLAIIVLVLLVLAGVWKAFVKAGKPGWAAIIPIYNIVVILEIAEKPVSVWWIILFLIPIVNLVVSIIVFVEIAQRFGKGTGFGVGLALLGLIFWPILGFGDAQYKGGAAAAPPVQQAQPPQQQPPAQQ